MPGKPLKAPSGFLTPKQVAERASKMGLHINPKVLADNAHEGKIRFWSILPGKKKGVVFPENNLMQVIAECPKKAIVPKGMFTSKDIYRIAKKKGLTVHQWDIVEKLERIYAGREQLPNGGLSQDAWHQRHRFFFPKQFVEEMLAEAKHRKNLPKMLEKGYVIHIMQLAKELGLGKDSLYRYKNLKIVQVGGKNYVTRKEAERFKEFYKSMKAPAQKPKAKKPAEAEAKKEKTVEIKETLARPVQDWRTKEEIEWWMKNMVPRVSDRIKRAKITSLLESGRNLPHEQFRKAVMTKINEILA